MMSLDELYQNSVAENEVQLKYWDDHLHELKSINFNEFSAKLKVPILVPIGKRIMFRGELKHTNEVTVGLGAGYHVRCSTVQAEVLKQHRIKKAEAKLELYRKEKEYLEKQILFAKENVFEKEGQEILEVYTEEEDKAWREKHRENIKNYKQSQAKELKDDVSDEKLWERLEELELQEELANELLNNYNKDKRKHNQFLEREELLMRNIFREEMNSQKTKDTNEGNQQENQFDKLDVKEVSEMRSEAALNMVPKKEIAATVVTNDNCNDKFQQTILKKLTEIKNELNELKQRQKEQTITEQDVLSRIEEMEQIDELEDKIERLDDILEIEDSTEEEDKSDSSALKKSISFEDENDKHKTLEITFTHTNMEPNTDPFDPEKGITKPSDVYEAFSQLFDSKSTSILKKSKYIFEDKTSKPLVKQPKQVMFKKSVKIAHESIETQEPPIDKTIIIKDVVENVGVNQHQIEGGARPTSLFKRKRMQNK